MEYAFKQLLITMNKDTFYYLPLEYVSPKIRVIQTETHDGICGSPKAGGNEDVSYDDWWFE